MSKPITYHTDERLTIEEYIDFLKRSDLGSMYPKYLHRNTELYTSLFAAILHITPPGGCFLRLARSKGASPLLNPPCQTPP